MEKNILLKFCVILHSYDVNSDGSVPVNFGTSYLKLVSDRILNTYVSLPNWEMSQHCFVIIKY